MRSMAPFSFAGLFVACLCWAQLAPQAPQAAYEGQNVGSVSLIANPHRDLTALNAVVTQKTGEPYAQKKVDESVSILQQKGNFEKVRVEVVPEVDGLRLNFVLEPAWYLGVLQFPGVTKTFSYTRL